MRRIFLVLCFLAVPVGAGRAFWQLPDPVDGPPGVPKTPSESRRRVSALVRDDLRRNRKDVAEILMLAESLMADMSGDDAALIVHVNSIRSAERIEKLAKDVKGRLKR